MSLRTAVVILSVMCAVNIVFFSWWVVPNLQDRTEQIQHERARAVRMNCEDVNHRHDQTIHQLDVLIRRLPPERRTKAVQNRSGTVLLIDALAPRRDCAELVRKTVTSPSP